MVAQGNCFACRPTQLLDADPIHCYGSGDEPAPPGVYGGFVCTCECRSWERPENPFDEHTRMWLDGEQSDGAASEPKAWCERCDDWTYTHPCAAHNDG